MNPKTLSVKALAFDAYGTLFDVHSVTSTAEILFPGQGAALSNEWRAAQLRYSWLRSLMGRYVDFEQVTLDALAFACKTLGLECEPQQRARLMRSYEQLSPFAEVPAALRQLSTVPLAILSNGTRRMLEAAVHHAGFDGVFADVLSADSVRIYKPSAAVYQLAVDRFDASSPSEIGFVSSNAWDIAGATAFGFTTFWINRSGGQVEELGVRPAAIIRGLDELAPLLALPPLPKGPGKE